MWTECASERPKRRRTHYQAQAVLLSLGGAGSVCSYSATHVFCLSHLFSFLSLFLSLSRSYRPAPFLSNMYVLNTRREDAAYAAAPKEDAVVREH